jgi:4-oxalocrotonate tautomerase
MPHVIVKMYPGRSREQKQKLADELAKTVIAVLGSKPESISIGIEDVGSDDWDEKVRKPDIVAKPDTIFKAMG